jgi:hypothetical protein
MIHRSPWGRPAPAARRGTDHGGGTGHRGEGEAPEWYPDFEEVE